MKSMRFVESASSVAVITLLAGCATWHEMDRTEKGTAVGAAGGALAGAAVGGPVGAVVGAGVGGYAGHYETKPGGIASNVDRTSSGPVASSEESSTVLAAQETLNDRGYEAGQVDGLYGPNTEQAVRKFQQANGIPPSGNLDPQTLSALGIRQ